MTANTAVLGSVGAVLQSGARLEARNVTKRFGGLVAVDDVTLTAEPGRVTALIGPNGAGKTTLFDCLCGMLTPDQGQLELDSRELTHLSPYERAQAGLGRTFQRLEIFAGMSVAENLQVAVEARRMFGFGKNNWRSAFTLGPGDSPEVVENVDQILDFVGLTEVRDVRAGD